MFTDRVHTFGKPVSDDRENCRNAKELLNSKYLYIFLEEYSNIKTKESPEYDNFINRYFNDEGYADIWRIPHLLTDLLSDNFTYHASLLNDEAFRMTFISFIGEFYNYFLKNSDLLLVVADNPTSIKNWIQEKQRLYNLITETYCRICEKLISYGVTKE